MPSFNPVSSFQPTAGLQSDTQVMPSVRAGKTAICDTFGPADANVALDWSPERPLLTSPDELPPPRGLPLSDYRMLAATDESRNLGNQIIDTLGLRLAAIKNKIREISADNIKMLTETAERASNSAWWSILKKIATCLVSALSIVFGVALAASGGGALIGGAMIASGILSLANFALSETGAWDWVAKKLSNDDEEWRNRLAMILPLSVGIVAGGIGLVGSVYSVATGAIPFVEKAVYVAQTMLAVFDGVTTFGKGQADAQLIWSQADLSDVQAQLTVQRTNFDSTMREIEGSLSDFRNVKSKTKKTIQIISQSNIQLVRQA